MGDPGTAAPGGRRYDIDALRAITVLLLIPFHTARVFDTFEPFYVKNAELSPLLSYTVIAFFGTWGMLLLFLLAGASSWYALGFRTTGQYLLERLRRLAVPFIFGLLVLAPPQSYFAYRAHTGASLGYLEFYPHFFAVDPEDLTGYFGSFTTGHLWFILFLLGYSTLALPLFRALRRESARKWIGGLAALCDKPGGLFLMALPIAVAGAVPEIGGQDVGGYFMTFLLGFLLMTDERFTRAVDRHMLPALLLGSLTMGLEVAAYARGVTFPDFSAGDIAFHFFEQFNAWFWLIALLGLARRYLNRDGRLLRYAREAAYPYYILHQTVIVVLAFPIVGWDLSLGAKYGLICTGSFALTLLLYEALVKRIPLLRTLFGLKAAN